VIHAIIDALLGAAGLGDIGEMFPDTDPKYKDIDSKELLKQVVGIITDKKFGIEHIDIIIQVEQPKLKNHKAKMKETLAKIMKINVQQINIKAKTNEGLDAIGKGQAISAIAVATIVEER